MKGFKRLMVGLDFTIIDQNLIQYAGFLAHYLDPEKIYFVNIQADLDVPDSVREAFPELNQPRDEKLRDDLHAEINKWFPNHHDYDVDFQIIEGSPRKELARWAHIKNIDLLIVGRKNITHGKGIVPQQLARKLGCSILFVPEKVNYRLGEIMVANDFSEYARSALNTALLFTHTDPDIKIISNHVYSLPQGYYRTGKSEEEFAGIIEEHARTRYENFVAGMDNAQAISPIFCYDKENKSAARMIYESAHDSGADLIVVGSRGHNSASAFLLGSVSEKLIRINGSTPVLMVKHRGEISSPKRPERAKNAIG
jgi:nucleotide-binding universal stress UspA family protein